MPTHNESTFNLPLIRGAVAMLQKPESFAALKSIPRVQVSAITGNYKYWDLDDLLRFEVQARKPGADFHQVINNLENKTFYCEDYGLEFPVPIETAGELGGNILEQTAAQAMQQGLMQFEVKMAETLFATSGGYSKVYDVSSDLTGVTWDNNSSNPIADIEEGLDYVEENTGLRPNVITCTRDVFRKLKQNQEIIDRLATDSLRILRTEDALATIFDVDEFNVTKATYISGNEKSSETRSAFATKKMVAHYKSDVNPAGSPNGALMLVTNYAGDIVGANGMGIETYFHKPKDSDIVRLKQRFDIVIPSADLGVVFNNCIA